MAGYAERVWAEALFCSHLQPSQKPDYDEVKAAVAERMRRPGIARCAACVAEQYGNEPTLAAECMTWCLTTVAAAFRDPVRV